MERFVFIKFKGSKRLGMTEIVAQDLVEAGEIAFNEMARNAEKGERTRYRLELVSRSAEVPVGEDDTKDQKSKSKGKIGVVAQGQVW